MMLTRATPFGEMLRFDPFGHWADSPGDPGFGTGHLNAFGPYLRFDVLEKDDRYEVKADLPGVKRQDVEVYVNGKDLEVVADVKTEAKEEADGKLLRAERIHGRMQRRMTLPEELEADKAAAAYENGVLTIMLPKGKHAKRRQLPVR